VPTLYEYFESVLKVQSISAKCSDVKLEYFSNLLTDFSSSFFIRNFGNRPQHNRKRCTITEAMGD